MTEQVTNADKSQATYVQTKYSDVNLTMQQKKEQQELMPAPLNPSSQFHGAKNELLNVNDEDQALEIDALTPSINNYQPQVITDTLASDFQNEEIFQTQYISMGNQDPGSNPTTGVVQVKK